MEQRFIHCAEVLPALTWEEVDRQLRDLAPAKPMQAMITDWLQDLREDAADLGPEGLWKELLCITWAVLQTHKEHFGGSPPSQLSH